MSVDRMERRSFTLQGLDHRWRSLVVGLGYALATMLGGMLAGALGLPPAELAAGMDPAGALLGILVSGVVIALALGALARRLPIPAWGRTSVFFLLVYAVTLGIADKVLKALEPYIPAMEAAAGHRFAAGWYAGSAARMSEGLGSSIAGLTEGMASMVQVAGSAMSTHASMAGSFETNRSSTIGLRR